MASVVLYNSSKNNAHLTVSYETGPGTFTVTGINGYYSWGKSWDATKNINHSISFPGGSGTLTSKIGSGNSGSGCGWDKGSGYEWDCGFPVTFSSTGGTGKISITVGNTGNSMSGTVWTERDEEIVVPTPFVPNSIASQSVTFSDSILYLKAWADSNATYNGYEGLYRQVEINPTAGGDDTWVIVYGTQNVSGYASGTLTITGNDVNSKGLLGTPLRANNEVGSFNGVGNEYYSANSITPPSNLMTAPTISGKPAVTKVTASQITINNAPPDNYIRTEGTAFYANSLVKFNDAGSADGTIYETWGMSNTVRLGTVNMDIGAYKHADMNGDPNTETVSAGTGYDYTLNRGTTYHLKNEAITKYLGVRKNTYGGLTDVYVPYFPTLTKTKFNYNWVNHGGGVHYHILNAVATLSNPNNENIGNKYLSMNNDKILVSSVSGNTYNADTGTDIRTNWIYNNSALNGLAHLWIYYATNHYSESIIDPLEITDSISVTANLINCSLGTLAISTKGEFTAGNCTFNMPDNTFAVGTTLNATLQISKSSDFSSITHQVTKKVTKFGTINDMFGKITLLGTNFYREPMIYSPTKTIEFTGFEPVIESFTAHTDSSGKIVVNVVENTGIPLSEIKVNVFRVKGGGIYQSFTVQNGKDYTLPYTEPGTIWYIEAQASNILGTVFAMIEGTSDRDIKTIQIPYTTTDSYETVAKPTISAGKVQLDGKCTLTMTWTKITTNVDHVQYNIRMVTTNNPITPTDHKNKQPGYNYTFNGRKDGEEVYFELECVLYNSFNEVIINYLIESNTIELDAVDLDKISYTFKDTATYHSINWNLVTLNKNNNKLVAQEVALVKHKIPYPTKNIVVDMYNEATEKTVSTLKVTKNSTNKSIKVTCDTRTALTTPFNILFFDLTDKLKNNTLYTFTNEIIQGKMDNMNIAPIYCEISITNKRTGTTERYVNAINDLTRHPNHRPFVAHTNMYSYRLLLTSMGQSDYTDVPFTREFKCCLAELDPENLIYREYKGDENPGQYSLDIDPFETATWENLQPSTKYLVYNDFVGVNPLDETKMHSVIDYGEPITNDFNVYPVRNLKEEILNTANNKPTENSNIKLTWDTPNKGDVDVSDYVVEYRKQGEDYKSVYVVDKQYLLAGEIVPLKNSDVVYIRVGARYLDWFGNYVIKWTDAPSVIVSSTNYVYYDCLFPNVERPKQTMYKIANGKSNEDLVRNLYIDK